MSNNLLEPFSVILPAIPSAGIYFFTTSKGIQYEVRFGRRKNNILHATIVFGVINDEFEGEEYVETNKGEVYRVMATMVEIIRIFMTVHPKVMIYEFTGIAREGEPDEGVTTRTHLYTRYLPIIFPESEGWTFKFQGSNAIVTRK
ncbi:MAG: hypothetical protein HY840_01710 [Bacteroidetes bacterium]|nr:hypothetical protein [Bacteroidota bacterium]